MRQHSSLVVRSFIIYCFGPDTGKDITKGDKITSRKQQAMIISEGNWAIRLSLDGDDDE